MMTHGTRKWGWVPVLALLQGCGAPGADDVAPVTREAAEAADAAGLQLRIGVGGVT